MTDFNTFQTSWNNKLKNTKLSDYAKKLKEGTTGSAEGELRGEAIDKLIKGTFTDATGKIISVVVDANRDGDLSDDAKSVIDNFVSYAEKDDQLMDFSIIEKISSGTASFNSSKNWNSIINLGESQPTSSGGTVLKGKEVQAEKLIVFLSRADDGSFSELIDKSATPKPATPVPSPTPVTPLTLYGIDFSGISPTEKANWMKALIPETGKPGTAFVFNGETYKYLADGKLQKEDTTTPSTFKDVDVKDVPMELKKAKGRLIMAVDLTKDLINKNLTSAFLSSEKLENANFNGANLTGAKLTGATLTNANFTNANLTSVVLAETLADALTVANLKNADLTGANLKDAKLQIGNPAKWYKITDTRIEIHHSAKNTWIPLTDQAKNLDVITAFENIIKDATNKDKATINSKNLTAVITELRKTNTTAPAATTPTTTTTPPTATTPATTSPATTSPATATTPTSATTTSGEPIMGIARTKFGDLLTADQTYLKWENGIALQTALNVKIIKGEITIGDKMPERLFVDGLFGEKSAMIAKAWLEKQPADITLKDLLSKTSSPPATGVETLDKVGGRMLGLGSGGDEVTALQTQLKKQLKIDLTVDGIYGTQTEAAVTAFQADWNKNHSNEAEKISEDGVAGPQTRGALQSLA